MNPYASDCDGNQVRNSRANATWALALATVFLGICTLGAAIFQSISRGPKSGNQTKLAISATDRINAELEITESEFLETRQELRAAQRQLKATNAKEARLNQERDNAITKQLTAVREAKAQRDKNSALERDVAQLRTELRNASKKQIGTQNKLALLESQINKDQDRVTRFEQELSEQKKYYESVIAQLARGENEEAEKEFPIVHWWHMDRVSPQGGHWHTLEIVRTSPNGFCLARDKKRMAVEYYYILRPKPSGNGEVDVYNMADYNTIVQEWNRIATHPNAGI